MYYPIVGYSTVGDGRIFAMSDQAVISAHAYISTDNAISYAEQDVSDNTANFQAMAWGGTPGNGAFCAVGGYRIGFGDAAPRVITSPSAETGDWTNQSCPSPPVTLRSVSWSPERNEFLIGADGGYVVRGGSLGSSLSVCSGRVAGGFTNVRRLYGRASIIVATHQVGPGLAYSEDDGATWNSCTVTNYNGGGAVNGAYRDVVYVPWLDLWVGGGNQTGGNGNFWSSDGKNFTFNGTPANPVYPGTGVSIFKIAFSDSLVSAVDQVTAAVKVSSDGKNYTEYTVYSGAGAVPFPSIIYNGFVWAVSAYTVAVNDHSNGWATDPSGSWTTYLFPQNGLGNNIIDLTSRWLL